MAIDDFSSNLDAQAAATKGAADKVKSIFDDLEGYIADHNDKIAKSFDAPSAGLDNLLKQVRDSSAKIQNDFSASLKDAIKNGGDFSSVFSKIGSALEDLVIQLAVVNPAMNTLFGGQRGSLGDIGGMDSGSFGGDNGLIGSLFGNIFGLLDGRAAGGPVSAGTPYIVGERGPELFVPQTSGRINPNAGSGAVNITMNITANDAGSFRSSQAQISASMLDAVRKAQRIR